MYDLLEIFRDLIGPDSQSITWWQMVIRSLLVFVFGLVLVRFGARRMFGRNTPFDVVLAIVIGSLLSRAITGNSPFFGTLAAVTALVALHWAVATFAFYFDFLGSLVKGGKRTLVTDGEINWAGMRLGKVGEKDLMEALRLHGVTDIADVQLASLERGGEISVVEASKTRSGKQQSKGT